MGFRLPSIKSVAAQLRAVNANVEGECDVRLCVWEDGVWCVRWGDVQYDSSHSSYCGAASVPGVVNGKVQSFDARDLARTLIEECAEQRAMAT